MYSYNLVLDFLKNKISEQDLQNLIEKYNIEDSEDMLDILADVVTDSDLTAVGFSLDETSPQENVDYNYNYNDVEDIVNFLTNCDDYIIDSLLNQYGCHSLEDLALALTDFELESLGYSYDNYDCDYNDDMVYSKNYDYDDNYDYLEDLPYDLNYLLVGDNVFATNNEMDMYRFKECLNPNLVDDFIIQESVDGKCVFSVVPHKYEIGEEVVINDELNDKIFDSEHHILPEVKQALLDYINGFIDKMKEQGVDITYSDICVVGSNAGYLYTPDSDIDIHIVSSKPIDLDNAEALFNEFDIYEDENPLFIGDSKVEIGIEDDYNITVNDKDSRRYSLINDDWVNDSDNLDIFTQNDLSKVSGYESIVDEYTNKINNAVDNDDYNNAVMLKEEIRQNRSDDLAEFGPLSMGNVVFKELRNNGSYGKLKNYIREKEIGSMILND